MHELRPARGKQQGLRFRRNGFPGYVVLENIPDCFPSLRTTRLPADQHRYGLALEPGHEALYLRRFSATFWALECDEPSPPAHVKAS